MSFRIDSERECIRMLESISPSPGEDKGHHLVSERFLSFPLASFFGMKAFSFSLHILVCLWQREDHHGREECRAHVCPSIRLRVPTYCSLV